MRQKIVWKTKKGKYEVYSLEIKSGKKKGRG